MRLKHGIQPACLRHLIYLQMEDAGWVSPFKVDPQVSMPGSWKTGFLLSVSSSRVTGLLPLSCVLGGAGILPGIFHGKLPLFHVGEHGYVAWEHLPTRCMAVKWSGWIVVCHLKWMGLPVPSQCQILSEVPNDGEPCSVTMTKVGIFSMKCLEHRRVLPIGKVVWSVLCIGVSGLVLHLISALGGGR